MSDNEVKALKCKLWRDRGGTLNQKIYRDITGKDKCIITNNFGEMLSIKARKGISAACNPNKQKFLLHEVNSIRDAFLSQKQEAQALGADVSERYGLGSRLGLKDVCCK